MNRALRLWAALLGWIAGRAATGSAKAWAKAGEDGRHNWPADPARLETAMRIGVQAMAHRHEQRAVTR